MLRVSSYRFKRLMGKSGVFISYARKDGEAFASALRERLKRDAPDVRVWQDRQEIEGGVGWWRQIEEALEGVEFLVIVMTDAVLKSDITRKEWRTARQRGMCVYPIKGPGFDFSHPRLTRWMKKAHIYDLEVQWPTFVEHLRRGCKATRVPFMAPDPPAGFVQRSSEFDQLRSLLLDPIRRDPVAITTALTGAGGFGKTTLACALCHDDDIALAFDDGILWTTLGQTPNVADALAKLYAGLTGERPQFRDAEDAATTLAEKLEHKNCLIVIDDVWDPARSSSPAAFAKPWSSRRGPRKRWKEDRQDPGHQAHRHPVLPHHPSAPCSRRYAAGVRTLLIGPVHTDLKRDLRRLRRAIGLAPSLTPVRVAHL